MSVKIQGHKLSSKCGISHFLTKADHVGAYTVESEHKGVGYIFETDEVAIVTTTGYIRMDVKSARRMIKELEAILDDISDLRRMEIKI